jgi:tRNA U34 2-thiouridine synthase MnmA/TrmU
LRKRSITDPQNRDVVIGMYHQANACQMQPCNAPVSWQRHGEIAPMCALEYVRGSHQAHAVTVAHKPDSHDICFIPDGDTRGWLADKVGTATGDIVDRTGAVVGTHEGAHAFTVGQRRGLSLGVPAPDGKPRFVLEVPDDNRSR